MKLHVHVGEYSDHNPYIELYCETDSVKYSVFFPRIGNSYSQTYPWKEKDLPYAKRILLKIGTYANDLPIDETLKSMGTDSYPDQIFTLRQIVEAISDIHFRRD